MGYIAHDAVVATVSDFDRSTIDALAAFMDALTDDVRPLVVGPVPLINGYIAYAFLPDGSKEGWDSSDEADALRAQFYEIASAGQGADAVHVRFGADHGFEMGTTVMATTDPQRATVR